MLIVHEAAASRFVARLVAAGPELGELTYVLQESPKLMDMQHTFVAAAGRGQGVGAKLADAASQWARESRYSILASCSYLSDKYFPATPPAGFVYNAATKVAQLQ
jgi:predicted GNAT family acetyltransferase